LTESKDKNTINLLFLIKVLDWHLNCLYHSNIIIIRDDIAKVLWGYYLNAWERHVEKEGGKVWSEVDGWHNQPFSKMETNSQHWPPNQRLYLTMPPIPTQLFLFTAFNSQLWTKLCGLSLLCFATLVMHNASNKKTRRRIKTKRVEPSLCSSLTQQVLINHSLFPNFIILRFPSIFHITFSSFLTNNK